MRLTELLAELGEKDETAPELIAVVEMPGTCSDRMAFICTPIANAFRPTRR